MREGDVGQGENGGKPFFRACRSAWIPGSSPGMTAMFLRDSRLTANFSYRRLHLALLEFKKVWPIHKCGSFWFLARPQPTAAGRRSRGSDSDA